MTLGTDKIPGDLIGEVLDGTYRITRSIGQGGMGSIYEATHVRLPKKRFAVKLLRSEAAKVPDLFARFRREAEVTTEIGHPNIVDVMDFHEMEDGRPYMVMEHLEGENLASRLSRQGRLEPGEVLELAQQVGSALQAAHDQGVVHRDMKPENIFLVASTEGIKAKVLDFGISKIQHSKSIVTEDHSLLGTVYFMSPEQAEGAVKNIGPATDIFALGAICYQALTGILPFNAPTIPGVIYQVCHAKPKPDSVLCPDLPEQVDQVMDLALAKERQQRYQRVDQFVQALGLALDGKEPATEGLDLPKPTTDSQSHDSGVDVFAPTVNPDSADAYAATHSSSMISRTGEEAGDELMEQVRGGSRAKALLAGGLVLALAMGGGFYLRYSGPGATAVPKIDSGGDPAPAAGRGSRPSPGPRPGEGPPSRPPSGEGQPIRPPSAAVKAASVADPVSKPANVRLRLVLSPENARVLLDGRRRKDNPLVLKADGQEHQLKVTARGHRPQVVTFVAHRSKSLEITLKRSGRRTTIKSSSAPAPGTAATARPIPPPVKKPPPPPAKTKTRLGESPSRW